MQISPRRSSLASLGLSMLLATVGASACSLLLISLGGCKAAGDLFASLDKPAARVTDARLTGLNLESAALTFDVKISNPYAVAIPLANLDYALASGDKPMLAGKAALSGSVPAKGSTSVAIPVSVRFSDVLSALSGVRPGAIVPYKADLTLSSDVPGIGPISLPMNHAGELPIPAVPDVEVAEVTWDKLDLSEIAGSIALKVTNPNQFDVDLSKLGYAVKLGGREIASGKSASRVGLGAGNAATVKIPFKLSAMQAGLAVLDMAKSASASYDVRGDLELKTRFGDLAFPYSRSGNTTQKR